MIKSSVLIGRYSSGGVPKRYKIVGDEQRPIQAISGNAEEFEKMMLSLFLLDKFLHSEGNLTFETKDRDIWGNARKDIEQLYHFLTERRLSVYLEERSQKKEYRQERLTSDEFNGTNRRTLCLFSGGLDSAAGALKLVRDKQSPTLSHTATGNRTLGRVEILKEDPALRGLPLIITEMRTPRDMKTPGAYFSPTNTRGLLFLSNAMVLASSLGFDEVHLAENGPLMINPHVSSKSVPTRNAHPYLISTIQKIYNQVTGSNLRIALDFKDETKAEIIANIAAYSNLINHTWSCFKVQGQAKMCGLCFACFVRRLSALAAGYEEPPNTYQFDPFMTELTQLGESLRTDMDILHDTLIYLKDMLNDDRLIEDELFMIPPNFFQDPYQLLRKFSQDVFLGLHNYRNRSSSAQLGPLGKFAVKVLEGIPASDLKEREIELNSLMKWDLEIRFKTP